MQPDAIVTYLGHVVWVEVTDAEGRCPEGALGDAAWGTILDAARCAGGRAVRTDRALVLDQESGGCDWSLGVQAVVDGLVARGFAVQRVNTIWCPTCDDGPMRDQCTTCLGDGYARESTPVVAPRGAGARVAHDRRVKRPGARADTVAIVRRRRLGAVDDRARFDGGATMTEARVKIWDGSGDTREVSLEELRRYFTAPLETWNAIVLVVLFGDDPLMVYPIHDGQCPAVDRAADHGETTLDHARRFFLDAPESHRSPRYADERDAVVARAWDEGAEPFWVSSAFVWSAEEAFAVASRFGLDGTACDAIEGRRLVWGSGWVASADGDSFGAWDVGIIRLDEFELEAPEWELDDQLPIDDTRLRWEEGTIAPRRTERGPIRLGFYVRGPIDPTELRDYASTGTWSVLNDLGVDQDAWLDALVARPMAALRHLGVGGVDAVVDRTKLERAITAQPRLTSLWLRLERADVPTLCSATLTQLFVDWRWTAREVMLLLERAKLPRLEWLQLQGCTCEGLDLSRLGPHVRVALLEATPGAIRAASSVASLWVRTIRREEQREEIERALAERRSAGKRLLLPIND